MELNINSPAYFTQEYGVDDEVYRYCQKCYLYFKDKEYSEVLKTIGICPIVAPDELCRQGAWKESIRFITHARVASIWIRIDFDQYYNATSEGRIMLMKDAILRAVKKTRSKGKFDYESFRRDLHDMEENSKVTADF